MANLLLNLIYSLTAELGSVVSRMQNYLGGIQIFQVIGTWFEFGLVTGIRNAFTELMWMIYKFVMGFMDMMEYVINKFLGIGTTVDDYFIFAKNNNILDSLIHTFKAVCAVALVLMIVFTIFAIVRQEWVNATRSGLTPDGNKKGPIIMRLFKGLMTMVALPIVVVIIIGGVNSVLTSFNRALKGDHDSTVAANVLATASYNSNKFRLYAERDQRIPITIQAYNPDNYKPDEKDELLYNIKSSPVQTKLLSTAISLSDNIYLTFRDSLSYSNNKFSNSSKYADYYENFICTPEQYQVLADFINYAELTQSQFYIRPMDDEFINWKYVNSAIYSPEEKSLTINYSDASDLNRNGSKNDSYSITYSMNVDVSSPISDSLETIKALLGLGDYSDNVYNEMERKEDSVNVVQWANKKVSIHFSKNFVRDNPKTWTATDEIIMYEYYRFNANNTFSKYAIDDFSWNNAVEKNNPVLLDAYIYTYRKYYEIADAYSPEIDVDCVLINGNYYITEISDEETDEYGNPYYNLKNIEDTNFLNSTYTTIFKCESDYVATVKLSDDFDLSNPNDWSYTDQIIIYEYYKDLSYNNEWSKYNFSQFKTGLNLPVYIISLHKNTDDIEGTPGFYTLINGVYYQLQGSDKAYTLYQPSDETKKFMTQLTNQNSTSTSLYKYNIKLDESYDATSGISTEGSKTADKFIMTDADTGVYYYYQQPTTTTQEEGYKSETSKLLQSDSLEAENVLETSNCDIYADFDLKFSSTFDYKDVKTWNYRDYFLFYIYSKYLACSGISISQLKIDGGLKGEVCRVGISKGNAVVGKDVEIARYPDGSEEEDPNFETEGIDDYLYLFRVDENLTKDDKSDTNDPIIYLKIEDILNISQMNVLNILDVQTTYNKNNFDKAYEDSLFIDLSVYTDSTIRFSQGESETKTFKFSDDINFSNVNSWTIGDFILFFLHEQGSINIHQSIENNDFTNKENLFKEFSYNAEVSTFNKVSLPTSLRVYKFGDSNPLYLSEDYIINTCKFSSIDDWWETNLINYITLKYSTGSDSNIVSDDITIANGIFQANYKDNVFAFNALVSELVKDYIFNISEVDWENYSNISTYTYNNPIFVENEISTWTVLDGIIYYLYGNVLSQSYDFKIAYKNVGTGSCLVIDNYAIELNEGDLGLNLVDLYTLESLKTTYDAGSYTADGSKIPNDRNFVVLNDYSSLIRYGNSSYSYIYASTENAKLTEFDIFMLDLEANTTYQSYVTLAETVNKEYKFDLYRVNNSSAEIYLKLGQKSDNTEAYFYKFNGYSLDSPLRISSSSSSLSCSKNLFEVEKDTEEPANDLVYKSFELFTPEEGEDSKITLLDLGIYSITNSIEEVDYKVYNLINLDGTKSGKQYISIDKQFFEYNSTQTEFVNTVDGLKNFAKDGSGAEVPNSQTISSLYEGIYKEYIVNSVSSTKNTVLNMINIDNLVGFDIDDYTTWTPLTIILYNIGAIDGKVTYDNAKNVINGIYITESYLLENKDKGTSYLSLKKEKDQATTNYYIDVTNLFTIEIEKIEGDKEETLLKLNQLMKDLVFINIANLYKLSEVNSLKTLTNENGEFHRLFSSYSYSNDVCQFEYTPEFNINNMTTWTWFDLLYYYYFDVYTTDLEFSYYEYGSKTTSNKYIGISNGYLTYYVKLNEDMFTKFVLVGPHEVEFNLNSTSLSARAIVYYSLTEDTTGSILECKLPDEKIINWIADNSTGAHYYIYKMVEKSSALATYDKISCEEISTSDKVSNYSVLDFVLKYAEGSIKSENNIILQYGSTNPIYYLCVENKYVNLTKLKITLDDLDVDAKTGKINKSQDKLLSEFVGYSDLEAKISNYDDTIKKYSLLKVKSDELDSGSTFVPPIGGMNKETGAVELAFSENFDMSDFTTWTLSDFMIYYMFTQSDKNFVQTQKNLQYYLNRGYVDATFCNITITDDYGNVLNYNVLLIGQLKTINQLNYVQNEKLEGVDYLYVNYKIFYELYGKKLTDIYVYTYSDTETPLNINLSGTVSDTEITNPTITDFGVLVRSSIDTQDFIYAQNSYYKINFSLIDIIFEYYKVNEVPSITEDENSETTLIANLRLSTGFNPYKVSTWTILDYIIVYEYTLNINNNVLRDLNYNDLKNVNFYIDLKFDKNNLLAVLEINSHQYNLSEFYTDAETEILEVTAKLLNSDIKYYELKNASTKKISYMSKASYEALDDDTKNLYEVIKTSDVSDINNAIKAVDISQENGYSIILLLDELRYNINVNTSDVTEEFEDTWVSNSTYYQLKDKETETIIFVQNSQYSEEKYPEETYEILSSNYVPAAGMITQEQYLDDYKNNHSKPRVELKQTDKTLLYSSKVKVNWKTATEPLIVNEYYKLENQNNKEIIYLTGEIISTSYTLKEGSTDTYYRNGDDTNTEYKILESPVIPESYFETDAQTYRNLDDNVYFNYLISLTRYSNYIISPNVLKVNWPEKLMNDMMVIYSDLNWANLLATDGWIDTLGDYHSGIASGQYITSGNSANVSAIGMVLSEFLLSLATKTTGVNNFADYSYSSLFNDKTIKALMLSMLGENEYSKLQNEASVFVDLFNTSFAAILDDIADERNINIKDGKVDGLEMSIYKSFLSTAVLSSDFAEYLYTIATRVLSQYTIYESLAKASGDYARYYAYFTGQTDESGKVVEAFSYSTFKELVKFENTNLRENAVPMFSFNYNAVYRSYLADKKLSYTGPDSNYSEYGDVWKYLDKYYSNVYLSNNQKMDDKNPMYCFMLDVYYSIRQSIRKTGSLQPTYLILYKQYLDGDVKRWNATKDTTINGASIYFEKYPLYEINLLVNRQKAISSFIKNWMMPIYTLTDLIGDVAGAYGSTIALEAELLTLDGEGAAEKANDILDRYKSIFDGFTNIQTVKSILEKVFKNNAEYSNYVTSIYNLDHLFLSYFRSEDSEFAQLLGADYNKGWNALTDTYNKIGKILDELSELTYLIQGQQTVKGSLRFEGLDDKVLDEVFDRLSSWYNNLGTYINNQKLLDSTRKASITFTLAQYAQNYVEQGFSFTIQNKQYLLKSTTSTARLGEYVYGGSFLERFGIPATYTSSDFTGIVEISSGYSESEDMAKLKISSFTSLRKFASKIADYTGKLYLLSNMMDLSSNNSKVVPDSPTKSITETVYNNKDSVLLTDYIYIENPNAIANDQVFSSNYYVVSTPEYLILDYIIQNKYLSMDTLYSLIVSEKPDWDKLQALGLNLGEGVEGSFNYINEDEPERSTTDEEKITRLRRYLWYVQTDGYLGGYSDISDNTQAGRVHQIFKNVILYLTDSVEDSESGLDHTYEGSTISFKNMNFQKLKEILMNALISYEKKDSESGDENTNRYLTIFYLICSEFNYFTSSQNYSGGSAAGSYEKYVGRTLMKVNNTLIKQGTNVVGYTSNNTNLYLRTGFKRDLPTTGLLLKLAGLENRPIEELVDRQYNNLYSKNGVYDEANGDAFIICSYNEFEGKYYPILMRNKNFNINTGNFQEYLDEEFGVNLKTDYYDSRYAYPIIAKGVMMGNAVTLRPTAIRMVNGEITYYRDSVTATTNIGDDAFQTGTIVSEVSTNNYIQYVPHSTFSGYGGSWAMYISANNPSAYINSDTEVYYLQYRTSYSPSYSDDYGAIDIFNDFTSYYNMDGVFKLLMMLGFLTMIPIMVKALTLSMRRILDLMSLILIAPLAIAMNSLEIEENGTNKAYQTWKQMFTHSLLNVFGIVISLNLYYILVNTALNMTYITAGDSTMTLIKESPVSWVQTNWMNAVVKFLFVITGSLMIESGANMLGSILTGQRVENSFTSGITNREPIEEMGKIIKEVKGTFDTFGKIYSGEILLEAKAAALEKAKQTIPGSAIMRRLSETAKGKRDKKQANELAEQAKACGIAPHIAQRKAFELRQVSQQIRLAKHKQSLQRANSFNKTMGIEGKFDDPLANVKPIKDKSKAKLSDVIRGAEDKIKEGAKNTVEAIKHPKLTAQKIGKKVADKVVDTGKKVANKVVSTAKKIKESPKEIANAVKNSSIVKNTKKVFKKLKEDPMGLAASMFGKGAELSYETKKRYQSNKKLAADKENESSEEQDDQSGDNGSSGNGSGNGSGTGTGGGSGNGSGTGSGGNSSGGNGTGTGAGQKGGGETPSTNDEGSEGSDAEEVSTASKPKESRARKVGRALLPIVSNYHLIKALAKRRKDKKDNS